MALGVGLFDVPLIHKQSEPVSCEGSGFLRTWAINLFGCPHQEMKRMVMVETRKEEISLILAPKPSTRFRPDRTEGRRCRCECVEYPE